MTIYVLQAIERLSDTSLTFEVDDLVCFVGSCLQSCFESCILAAPTTH